MKKAQIRYWSEKMVDSSKTSFSYRSTSYRYDHNTLTFVRTDAGKVTGRYRKLSDALKEANKLSDEQVLTGMQERATELSTFATDSLIRSIVDRFSTFENGLRILFTHLYTARS